MRPVRLKINGINSFETPQEVNFEELAKYSLFGIFGDTGSGKTTIIDCIILALYNRIPRLKKINVINTECNNGNIEYEFKIFLKGVENHYLIKRNYERNKSGGTKSYDSTLIDLKSNRVVAINSKIEQMIVDITGLTYEDFTKSVILPQGQFSEFLNMRDSDKSKMLERIFKLEAYGKNFTSKIKIKKSEIFNDLKNLQSNIETLGDVKKEEITIIKKEKINKEEKIKLYKEDYNNSLDELQKLKSKIEKSQSLVKSQKELDILNEEENDYFENKIKLDKGTKLKNIKPVYDKLKTSKEKLNSDIHKIGNLELEEECLIKTSKEVEKEFNKLKICNEEIITNIKVELSYVDIIKNDILVVNNKEVEYEELLKNETKLKEELLIIVDKLEELEKKLFYTTNKIEILNKEVLEINNINRELLEKGNYEEVERLKLEEEVNILKKEITKSNDKLEELEKLLEENNNKLKEIDLNKLYEKEKHLKPNDLYSIEDLGKMRTTLDKYANENIKYKEHESEMETLLSDLKTIKGEEKNLKDYLSTLKLSKDSVTTDLKELKLKYEDSKIADIVNEMRKEILNGREQ